MKQPMAILLVSTLAACSAPLVEDPLRPVYHATFELDPPINVASVVVDEIPSHTSKQPLEQGQSGVSEIAQWNKVDGTLAMMLTAPMAISEYANPSMGVFSTGLDLGQGKVFLVRATFQRPKPLTPPIYGWSVGVAARTGGKEDRYAETKLGVTLSFAKNGPELRFREGDTTTKKIMLIPQYQEALNNIIKEAQPFTLELWVDRKAGRGAATLITRGASPRIDFDMSVFKKDDGPPITTVGATLANCCTPGSEVFVEVTDFQIWMQGRLRPGDELWTAPRRSN